MNTVGTVVLSTVLAFFLNTGLYWARDKVKAQKRKRRKAAGNGRNG